MLDEQVKEKKLTVLKYIDVPFQLCQPKVNKLLWAKPMMVLLMFAHVNIRLQ